MNKFSLTSSITHPTFCRRNSEFRSGWRTAAGQFCRLRRRPVKLSPAPPLSGSGATARVKKWSSELAARLLNLINLSHAVRCGDSLNPTEAERIWDTHGTAGRSWSRSVFCVFYWSSCRRSCVGKHRDRLETWKSYVLPTAVAVLFLQRQVVWLGR